MDGTKSPLAEREHTSNNAAKLESEDQILKTKEKKRIRKKLPLLVTRDESRGKREKERKRVETQ